ncbi:RusA family crossover junction endodeoxyribonuclease [Cryobacterium fucosi]|uniref:RusA family crossover junction endodeoxyribonuclease n=1 Tax=Cryobacterium fucosi TaxID=1259157 RepID=UPI001583D678|nr:RusA family crossover junction endodeoxyribonuclease [Cryobacterium fucosi]
MFTVFVPGEPGPQGSKIGFSKIGTTKVQMVEASKKVKPWRLAIVATCTGLVNAPIDDPVRIRRLYLFDRPKTVTREFPIGNEGDIDKLDRATFDGLVMAGVLRDDRLVVAGSHMKRYVTAGQKPGAWLRIEILPF